MIKYTSEILQKAAATSVSILEVMRKIGCRTTSGSSHQHIKRMLHKYSIDTSHFLGCAYNKGKSSNNKKTADQILVIRNKDRRERGVALKRALHEKGVPYRCNLCGIIDWNNKMLTLEVNHKNGNCLDNRLENLELLCPNCHSQDDHECNAWKNTKIK
jgi:hypothetical protein